MRKSGKREGEDKKTHLPRVSPLIKPPQQFTFERLFEGPFEWSVAKWVAATWSLAASIILAERAASC